MGVDKSEDTTYSYNLNMQLANMKKAELMTNVYKYSMIKADLIKAIESGSLKPHDRLFSQSEIISRYDTSVTTANRVLNELTFEGYAYRVKGKGSFVAEPKPAAKRLCVTVPFLINEHSSSNFGYPLTSSILLHYIQDECTKRGWTLQLYVDQKDPSLRSSALAQAIDGMDGVILCQALSPGIAEELELLKSSRIPSVMLDTYLNEPDMNIISTNSFDGAYKATELLYRRGYKRIVFFGRELKLIGEGMRSRREGYLKAMQKLGLKPEIAEHNNDADRLDDTFDSIARDIFGRSGIPAILSDHIGHIQGLCYSFMENGISTKGVTLATFDNFPIQLAPQVPIIKIVQPFEQMARASVRKIIAINQGHCEITHELLPAKLVVDKTVSRGIRIVEAV